MKEQLHKSARSPTVNAGELLTEALSIIGVQEKAALAENNYALLLQIAGAKEAINLVYALIQKNIPAKTEDSGVSDKPRLRSKAATKKNGK